MKTVPMMCARRRKNYELPLYTPILPPMRPSMERWHNITAVSYTHLMCIRDRLDPVSGRIAKQLYPKADITVGGFETTDRRDFFEMCIRDRPKTEHKKTAPKKSAEREI